MCYAPVLLIGLLSTGFATPQAADPATQAFLQRVDEYVALHRRLEGPLPRQTTTDNPAALFAPKKALAAALRRERRNAKQGEIFAPEIANHFRRLVANALREGGVVDMLAIVEDENTVHVPARVNADYPAGASISLMPPCLLAALPQLPPEIEYRFLGRDLILWDVHAGLIVDFVPGAVPVMTTQLRGDGPTEAGHFPVTYARDVGVELRGD